jgi:hypothetical protein
MHDEEPDQNTLNIYARGDVQVTQADLLHATRDMSAFGIPSIDWACSTYLSMLESRQRLSGCTGAFLAQLDG